MKYLERMLDGGVQGRLAVPVENEGTVHGRLTEAGMDDGNVHGE